MRQHRSSYRFFPVLGLLLLSLLAVTSCGQSTSRMASVSTPSPVPSDTPTVLASSPPPIVPTSTATRAPSPTPTPVFIQFVGGCNISSDNPNSDTADCAQPNSANFFANAGDITNNTATFHLTVSYSYITNDSKLQGPWSGTFLITRGGQVVMSKSNLRDGQDNSVPVTVHPNMCSPATAYTVILVAGEAATTTHPAYSFKITTPINLSCISLTPTPTLSLTPTPTQ